MFENLRFSADLFAVAIWRCCASAQSRRRRGCEDRKEARPLLRLGGLNHAPRPLPPRCDDDFHAPVGGYVAEYRHLENPLPCPGCLHLAERNAVVPVQDVHNGLRTLAGEGEIGVRRTDGVRMADDVEGAVAELVAWHDPGE